MNAEAQKLEIIGWLLTLKDPSIISKIIEVKKSESKPKIGDRKFGCGKGIFTYVSNDFDEPLPDFKDYMK
jgi:hypothetical protein